MRACEGMVPAFVAGRTLVQTLRLRRSAVALPMGQHAARPVRPCQPPEDHPRGPPPTLGCGGGQPHRADPGLGGAGFRPRTVRDPRAPGTRSFQEGGFYLQDPSTLLAIRELDPRPGEALLDLCAAPGGKTLYMAERMANVGRITAHDPSEGRLALLRENARRLGATCVTASHTLPPPAPEFDGILVDAPVRTPASSAAVSNSGGDWIRPSSPAWPPSRSVCSGTPPGGSVRVDGSSIRPAAWSPRKTRRSWTGSWP